MVRTLKALANPRLIVVNAFSVEWNGFRSQGCRQLQPWAEIGKRLRRSTSQRCSPTIALASYWSFLSKLLVVVRDDESTFYSGDFCCCDSIVLSERWTRAECDLSIRAGAA